METKNCRVGVVVALGLVSAGNAQSLTTTFAGGNGYAGNMFDLRITNSNGLLLNSWDIHVDTPGATFRTSIYWRLGSHVGNETNPASWNVLGTATSTSAGLSRPTPLSLGGLFLPANTTVGIYVVLTDYTASGSPPPGVPTLTYSNGVATYSNSDLSFASGNGRGPARAGSTTPFDFDIYYDRIWNGTVRYTVLPAPGVAGTVLALTGAMAGFHRRTPRRSNCSCGQ